MLSVSINVKVFFMQVPVKVSIPKGIKSFFRTPIQTASSTASLQQDKIDAYLKQVSIAYENKKLGNKLNDYVKRGLDLSIALPAKVLTLPILGMGMAAAKISNPGQSIFLIQNRLGRGGKLITIKKIRTLIDDPKTGKKTTTRALQFLRKNNIDELPELNTVIKGDASLVGWRMVVPADAAATMPIEAFGKKPGFSWWFNTNRKTWTPAKTYFGELRNIVHHTVGKNV